jgi:hypothetical protein
MIGVTCPCRAKKGTKKKCPEVVELRKEKGLAKDSNAVLDCDETCSEKKKQQQKEKDAEAAVAPDPKKKGFKKGEGKKAKGKAQAEVAPAGFLNWQMLVLVMLIALIGIYLYHVKHSNKR